jgi:hypothetical protein
MRKDKQNDVTANLIITMQSATVYNFIYLAIGSESIAEAITIKAVAAVYKKLHFTDDNTFQFGAIKYAYRHGKLISKKEVCAARGEELMMILSHYNYDTRCILFMRYKLRYTYEKISEIMKLPVDEVKRNMKIICVYR